MSKRPPTAASLLGIAAWTGALASVLVALLALGDHLGAPPAPVTDLAAIRDWINRTDPAVTTFALLRLGAVVVVGYLLATTMLVLVGRLLHAPVLVAASVRLALPGARPLVRHLAGAGVAIALVSSSGALGTRAGASTPPAITVAEPTPGPAPVHPARPAVPATDPPPILHVLPGDLSLVHLGPTEPSVPDDQAHTPTTDLAPPDPVSEPSAGTGTDAAPDPMPPGPMTALPTPPTSALDPTTPASVAGPDEATDDPIEHASASTSRHHTIVAGDHLWGVSERTLAEAHGSLPDPADVARYVHRLIELNRSVLVVPDDPDLVLPGQVFELPAV